MQPRLDHIVYAMPDLELGCEAFADRTGIRPQPGGAHGAMGTANALVRLSEGTYLELLAPAKESAGANNLGGRLARFDASRLFAWALRLDELAPIQLTLESAGLNPTPVIPTSRERENGERLEWHLLGIPHKGGAWPFFISWEATPHPSSEAPSIGSILSFRANLPLDRIDALPFAKAEGVQLATGPAQLSLAFESPRGPVEWVEDEPIGFFG